MTTIVKINVDKASLKVFFKTIVKINEELNEISFVHGTTKRRLQIKELAQAADFYTPNPAIPARRGVTPYATSRAGEQSGHTMGRLRSTGLQAMPSEGRHSWHSGAHPPPLSSPDHVRVTLSDDYGPGVAVEQLADVGRSDPELRGLNDHASTGSGPTRQSDARDSKPLHVSVAGTRAGCLIFDTRSFFLMRGRPLE
jgi:hypothetical protein